METDYLGRKIEYPSRIELWLEKWDKTFFLVSHRLFSIVLIITLPLALMLAKINGPHMLWVFGGPMIVVSIPVVAHGFISVWCEMQAVRRERERIVLRKKEANPRDS